MSKPTVLLIGDLAHTTAEWDSLSSKYTLLSYPDGTRADFLSKLTTPAYSKLVALYRSNQSTPLTGPFDAELVSKLPSSLKFICHNGAGYDNIDVPACNKRQIGVSSTPIAVDDATADVATFLLLGALRQAQIPLTALREGKWRGDTPIGRDPKGKILGIVGMGGIGTAFAHRARAFGMQIHYHNRRRLSSNLETPLNATYHSTLSSLLSTCDILSLNLSLNASTRHIISAGELSQLKRGAILINTARGALINESDLVSALESGQLSSVGLDVFENEPEIHPGLVKNDRAFLLPHVGTNTVETQREMELLVLKNLETAVDKGALVTRVSEQVDRGLEWVRDAQVKGNL